MPQTLSDMVGTLRLHMLTEQTIDYETRAALSDLIDYALMAERALLFYSDPENYIDGVPMQLDQEGLLTVPDDGSEARYALGEDFALVDERQEAA